MKVSRNTNHQSVGDGEEKGHKNDNVKYEREHKVVRNAKATLI